MTVYVDVLMLINLYINFLLLRITSRLSSVKVGFWRTLAGAVVGSIGSLYILLPEVHFLLTAVIRAVMAAAIVFAAFGRRRPATFARLFCVMYLTAFVFAGIMFAVWTAVRPSGMLINNSVVYFNISPMLLIITSAVCYGVTCLISSITRRVFTPQPPECTVTITYDGRTVELNALVDTGNKLRDSFTDTPVIVVDSRAADTLLSARLARSMATVGSPPDDMARGYRLIPYSVVGSQGLMPAFTADAVSVTVDKRVCNVQALIGISSEPLTDRYGAIIGSDLLDN